MSSQLSNAILRDIDTLVREIHALYESKFKSYALQRGQFIFLTRIYENPGISLRDLSYELKLDKTTITRAIQKLIDSGYLIKQQDEYESKFKSYALQRGQFIFLTRIYENPGISLRDLSYELKLDKTTITRAIQKLIDSGYLIKQQDEIDKRVWHLFSTDKCKELYDEIITEKNRIILICFNGIDPAEVNNFAKIVNIILNNISNEWDKLINKNLKFGD